MLEPEMSLCAKEDKTLYQKYIAQGFIEFMVAQFAINKVGSGIREVLNSCQNGKNATLFFPGVKDANVPEPRKHGHQVFRCEPTGLSSRCLRATIPEALPVGQV
mmetsp:Transcript_11536/g.33989  ORF Transcript_11536/g.33989 Transcript_11536/m.33989 type:complete len:104 (+) Transcript_11536:3841-4152(+)